MTAAAPWHGQPIEFDNDTGDSPTRPVSPAPVPFRPPHLPPEVAVIVAGGEDFVDVDLINRAMEAALARSKFNTLRHLGRPGCQQLAGRWSLQKPHLWQTTRPGTWADMVKLGAIACIAFPCADAEVIGLCEAAGIPVWWPYRT